jgi:hypothetical protein
MLLETVIYLLAVATYALAVDISAPTTGTLPEYQQGWAKSGDRCRLLLMHFGSSTITHLLQ